MSNREKINKKVDETLAIMDQMETLKANPYFYARIQARLHRQERERAGGFLAFMMQAFKLRPAYLALLMLVNIISASVFLMVPTPTKPVDLAEYKTHAAQMVKDYSLSQDTYTNTYADQVTEKMVEEKTE